MNLTGFGKWGLWGWAGPEGLVVCTWRRARVAAEPAEFWALHWYQPASEPLALRICSVEAPLWSL